MGVCCFWGTCIDKQHSPTLSPNLSKMIGYFVFQVIWWKFLILFHVAVSMAENQNITVSVFFQHCAALPQLHPTGMQAILSNTIPTSLMLLWLRIWSKYLEPVSKIYWKSFQEVWVLFRQHINVCGFVMRYSTIKYGCNVWLSTCFLPSSVAISLFGALCSLFFPQHSPT